MSPIQWHLELFALTVADHGQIHYFARLGLAERCPEVFNVVGSYSINSDDKFV
jgi:hypothetical protein